MNEEDETVAGNGDYQRELTELLNLLKAVDQQITPEHVNDRFTELLRDIGGTPDNVVTGEFSHTASDEFLEEDLADCDLISYFQEKDRRASAAYDRAERIVAEARESARNEAFSIITQAQDEAEQLNREAAANLDRARQVRADAQREADTALIRAASMIADARSRADQILDKAREDATAIIKFAREEAAEIREEARQEQQHATAADIGVTLSASVHCMVLDVLVLSVGFADSPPAYPDMAMILAEVRSSIASEHALLMPESGYREIREPGHSIGLAAAVQCSKVLSRCEPIPSGGYFTADHFREFRARIVHSADDNYQYSLSSREVIKKRDGIGAAPAITDGLKPARMALNADPAAPGPVSQGSRGPSAQLGHRRRRHGRPPLTGPGLACRRPLRLEARIGHRENSRISRSLLACMAAGMIAVIIAVVLSLGPQRTAPSIPAAPGSLASGSTAEFNAIRNELMFKPGATTFADPASAADALSEIATWAHANRSWQMGVLGFTATVGSSADQRELSLERAKVVRSELAALGASSAQIPVGVVAWDDYSGALASLIGESNFASESSIENAVLVTLYHASPHG